MADRVLTRRTASATRFWSMSLAGWYTASQLPAGAAQNQTGDDGVRIIAVRYQLQHADQQDSDRHGEVQQVRRPRHERIRVAQISVKKARRTLRRAGEQRPGVRQHHGVVVDVDD